MQAIFALTAFRGIERDYVIAGLERGDAFADFQHDTGTLMAENGRECAFWIGAGQGELVGMADTGCLDLDQNLTRLRAFQIHFFNRQGFACGICYGGACSHG